MPTQKCPRILVVDDDLGVIAAYRHVMETSKARKAKTSASATDSLEAELFGNTAPQDTDDIEWRVTFVDQGDDAVEAVRASVATSDPFAVVFLDIRMPPGIDGYDTAELIRKLDPRAHIVVVSGYSDYSDEDLSEVAGPIDVLTFMPKPVWPHQLRSMAASLCRERLMQDQAAA